MSERFFFSISKINDYHHYCANINHHLIFIILFLLSHQPTQGERCDDGFKPVVTTTINGS